MSRLTVNDLDKVAYNAWELCGMDADCTADCEGCFVNAIYLKLAHYEDLEEQGRLIELPCKVGDTIYHIMDDWRGKPTIRKTKFSYFWLDYEFFLTKEEAEAKLAELKGTEE